MTTLTLLTAPPSVRFRPLLQRTRQLGSVADGKARSDAMPSANPSTNSGTAQRGAIFLAIAGIAILGTAFQVGNVTSIGGVLGALLLCSAGARFMRNRGA